MVLIVIANLATTATVRVNERVRMRERESEGGKQIEYVINVL